MNTIQLEPSIKDTLLKVNLNTLHHCLNQAEYFYTDMNLCGSLVGGSDVGIIIEGSIVVLMFAHNR